MKRFTLFFLALSAGVLHAQDLSKGHTFVDGDTVHAADLNTLVDSATILRTFISNKSVATPLATDSVLFDQASTSTLKKVDVAGLVAAGNAVTTTTTRTANTVLAGPTSGAAAAPTFRLLKPPDTTSPALAISASTIDASLSHVFYKQLAANTTFTITGMTNGQVMTAGIRQAASTGPFTATFTGVTWKGGVAPTQTTTASKIDFYTFIFISGVGTFGSASQNY